MGMNRELRKLSLKQKLAILEILEECPSCNEERLPAFYKRMGFPDE
jgi:hypothetical protein